MDGSAAILRSADSGATVASVWHGQGSPRSVTCTALVAAGTLVYAATSDGRVLVSHDQGDVWQTLATLGSTLSVTSIALNTATSVLVSAINVSGVAMGTYVTGAAASESTWEIPDKAFNCEATNAFDQVGSSSLDDASIRLYPRVTWAPCMAQVGPLCGCSHLDACL